MASFPKLRKPAEKSRKGENGRLLIIGGSKDYHGAPMFSILAARRFVDLLYFYPSERDQFLINSVKTIPEAIIVYDMNSKAMRGKLDCILFGIGMSGAKVKLPKTAPDTKLVIDGDGLKRIKGNIPRDAILTPHENEFRMLFGIEGSQDNVRQMAEASGCVIVKKGSTDIISDGKRTVTNKIHNQGMTKGGTGDVLAGLLAALACKNESFEAAVAATMINGHSGNLLFKRYGYNFSASDLAEKLSEAAFDLEKR